MGTIGESNSRSAYDTWHTNRGVGEAASSPWHHHIRRYLRDVDFAGMDVLEIGCGRSELAVDLNQRYPPPKKYIAADFSPAAVQMGKQASSSKVGRWVNWAVSDIQRLPFPDATFNTVISCETIEHVPDPKLAIQELARVLKPGGRLLLTTPNYVGTIGLYRGYMRLTGRRFTETGQPINNFMLLPMTRAWVAKHLDVVAVDGIGQYLPFPGRPPIELSVFNQPRWLMRWFALHSFVMGVKRA